MAVRELTDGEKAELNAQPGVLSRLAIGSNLQEMQRAINAGGGQPYAKIVDKKSSGTNGGTFTSGAWQTRTLNLIDTNEAGIVTSLSGNRFTLAAGTYYVSCRAPAFSVERHRIALYKVTAGNYALYGESHYAYSGVLAFAAAAGIINTDGTYEYELRHRCEVTRTNDGLGVASSFGVDEIYSTVEIFGRSPV